VNAGEPPRTPSGILSSLPTADRSLAKAAGEWQECAIVAPSRRRGKCKGSPAGAGSRTADDGRDDALSDPRLHPGPGGGRAKSVGRTGGLVAGGMALAEKARTAA